MESDILKETELYNPVKELLLKQGYEIRSEVKDADIAAVRDDELVIVELKTSFNIKLLIQAAKRQRLTEDVYVAIPRPVYKKRFNRDFKDREYLLRRLGLGLIFVAMDAEIPYASVVLEPAPFDMERSRASSKRKKKKLLKEHQGRSSNYNTGGSVRKKLVTAYREKSLRIAMIMKDCDEISTKEIKEKGGPAETTRILYDNHYGWFDKTGRARYSLNKAGVYSLNEYAKILPYIEEEKK